MTNIEPRLSAMNVNVKYDGLTIVNDANLVLNAGELTILAGPNGAGKTTLARAMAGLSRYEGKVLLNGASILNLSPREKARAMAYLPQGHQYHWPLSVADIVALGREPHSDMFSRRTALDRKATEDALKMTGIEHLAHRTVTTLSGGERARVALTRALATQARVMIADEPIASVDERNQLIIMHLLKTVARSGIAVLAIIHDLSLAMRFADSVALMRGGRIVANGTPESVLTIVRIADIFGVAVELIETTDGPALFPTRAI